MGIYSQGTTTVSNSAEITTTGSGVKGGGYDGGDWVFGAYINGDSGKLTVSGSAKITATNGTYGSVGVQYQGTNTSGKYVTVSITGGTVSGGSYGISGNGSCSYSKVTISDGSIIGGSVGYYHPEMGTLDITGGSITGKYAGLQICAGTVTISGGTFTATATSAEISASGFDAANKTGDGVIADGAAVSVINRSGYGTYTSGSSVTSVSITGGTFVSAEGVESIQAYSFDSTNKATEWTDKDTYVTVNVTENAAE